MYKWKNKIYALSSDSINQSSLQIAMLGHMVEKYLWMLYISENQK